MHNFRSPIYLISSIWITLAVTLLIFVCGCTSLEVQRVQASSAEITIKKSHSSADISMKYQAPIRMSFVNGATGIGFIPDSVIITDELSQTLLRLVGDELKVFDDSLLKLDQGIYHIDAFAKGYYPMHLPLQITNGDQRGYAFNMDPLVVPYEVSDEYANLIDEQGFTTLIGYVLNSKNQALSGVKIYTQEPASQTYSDENGYYQLRIPVNETYLYSKDSAGFFPNFYTDIYFEKESNKTLILGNQPIGLKGVWYGKNPKLESGVGIIEHRTPLPWEIDWEKRSSSNSQSNKTNGGIISGIGGGTNLSIANGDCLPQTIVVGFSSSGQPCNTGNCSDFGKNFGVYSLESYVQHVLPNEWLSNQWQNVPNIQEAWRAAAVQIRTFAIWNILNPASPGYYHICSKDACQVFGQKSNLTNPHVNATAGYILVDGNGKPIKAEYSAENSGRDAPNHCAGGSNLSPNCNDGYFQSLSNGACVHDPTSLSANGTDYYLQFGHNRGMSQFGSVRWASGLAIQDYCTPNLPGNISGVGAPQHGHGTKNWQQIVSFYNPGLSMIHVNQACNIDCSSIETLQCGVSVNRSNVGNENNITTYSCNVQHQFNGPEKVFQIQVQPGLTTVAISNVSDPSNPLNSVGLGVVVLDGTNGCGVALQELNVFQNSSGNPNGGQVGGNCLESAIVDLNSNSASLTFSSTNGGTYYIVIDGIKKMINYNSSGTSVIGTTNFDTSVGSFDILVTSSCSQNQLPNLTKQTHSLSISGTTVNSSVSILNDGTLASGITSTIRFFLSSDNIITQSDFEIGNQSVPNIAPGATYNLSFSQDVSSVVPSIPAGSYFVGYIIDADEGINESNESDNFERWLTPKMTLLNNSQALQIPYKVNVNAPIQYMNNSDVTSDFGRRNCVSLTPWHKGVDYSPGSGNTDVGYELLNIEGGHVKWIYEGPNPGHYKFLAVEGYDGHHFGYAHIFTANSASVSSGTSLSDFTIKPMMNPNQNRLAIIYHPNGQFQSAICADNYSGPGTPQVLFNGTSYPCQSSVSQGQAIAPLGNSGTMSGHLHLYSFLSLSAQQSPPPQNPDPYSIVIANNQNSKDPLQFISHQEPTYLIDIFPLDPVSNQVSSNNNQIHYGDHDNTIYITATMQNAGGSGLGCDQIYSNSVMNIDKVSLLIKDIHSSPSQYNLIQGPFFESYISHGARTNTQGYPSLIYSQSGGVGTTGIKPFAYGVPGASASTPYDEFYFADFVPRIHKNSPLAQGNAVMAKINEDALYPDGKYSLKAEIETVTGNSLSSSTEEIVIDNFRPFIQKVEVVFNNQTVASYWNWTGISNSFVTSNGLVDPNYSATIRVTASEPMNQVSLSIPDIGFSQQNTTSVGGSGDVIWEFVVPASQLSGTNSCHLGLSIDGLDYQNNPIESNPQNIPIHQSDGTWSPNPTPGPDTHHSISFSGSCGSLPPCTDNFESNNSIQLAQPLNPPLGSTSYYGGVGSFISTNTDVDFFSLQLLTSGTLTIHLTNLPTDYDLELVDGTGTPLAPASTSTGVSDELINFSYSSTSPATVYIKIQGKGGLFNKCIPYELIIYWTPGNGCQDTEEPNDLPGMLNNIFPLFYNVPVNHPYASFLSTNQDQDVFVLGLDGMGTLTLTLSNLPADYVLELLDFSGTTVLQSSNNPGTQNEQIIFTYATPTSTIRYVRIRGVNGANDPCSPYTLNLNWVPILGCVDSYEDNNTFGQAATPFDPLTLTPYNHPINSAIFSSGDLDFFAVDIEEPGSLSIDLTSLPQNYDLYFLDSDGVSILGSSTLSGVNDEQITFFHPNSTPNTYFIRVEGNANAFDPCSRYDLSVSWNPNGGCVPPQIPLPVSPGTDFGPGPFLNTLTPNFTWTTDPNATNYELAISEYPYGSNHLVFDMCLSGPPYTLPAGILTYGKKYRWDVQANINCSTCESPISWERYFQTMNPVQPFCSGITVLTAPGGVITDGSGINLYQNNSDCQWLIQTAGATSIELAFQYLSTEQGVDYVTIYDGNSVNDPVLGSFSGNTLPPKVYSSGDEVLIHFTSNGGITNWGWQVNYQARYGGIVEYEYWFDQNFGSKISAFPASIGEIDLDINLPTTNLTPGLHTFHIRFLDDLGHWSSPISQYFHKGAVSDGGSPEIVAYEYWIDQDYGNKVSVSSSPQQILDIDELLDLSNISPGLHAFHIRFLDEFGHWSSPLSQYFHKGPVSDGGAPEIVAYEYWMDDDYTNKVSISSPPQEVLQIDTLLDVATLSQGLHTFRIRFLDEFGQWSSTLSQYFHKVGKPGLPLPNLVVSYRYWFDEEDSALVYQSLAVPVSPLDLMVDIDATALDTGYHRIHFQFLDTMEYWSSVLTDTFYRGPLVVPVADFAVANPTQCVGTAVSFQNSSSNANVYLWDFGDGTNSGQENPSHTYQNTGVYTVSLIATDTTTGFTDTLTQSNFVQVLAAPQLTSVMNDTICTGGSIQLLTGGADTYAWSPAGGLSSTSGSSVIASPSATTTYTITGTNLCGNDTETVTITVDEVQLTLLSTDPTCGLSNGSIASQVNGGIGNIAYTWNTGASTQIISGLPAGSYNLTITDQEGCTDMQSIVLNDIPGPILTASTLDANCGNADGGATALTTNGTAPFSFNWSNGASGQTVSGLVAGAYQVWVTDANNCVDTTDVLINDLPGPTLAATVVDANCGNADGSASASVSTGGTAPFSYVWSTGDSSQQVSNLLAGTYQVWVTDLNNCTDTIGLVLNDLPGPILAATAIDANCGNPDGSATAIPSGGSSPFAFSWSNGATGQTASNLQAGTYQVWVTDANNCVDTTSITLLDLPGPTISATGMDANCGNADGLAVAVASGGTAPYIFNWNTGVVGDSLNNIPAGSYQVWVTDVNNCADTIDVLVNNIGGPQLSLSSIDLSCSYSTDGSVTASISGGTAPFGFAWSTGDSSLAVNNLSAGIYTFSVLDAIGCLSTDTISVLAPTPIALSISEDQSIACYGDQTGILSVQSGGGTGTIVWLWNTGQTTDSLSQLGAGSYDVLATDANGCQDSASYSLSQPDSLVLITQITEISCFGATDGGIQLQVSGGTGMYTYSWSSGDSIASLSNLGPGTYTTQISDENGCLITDSISLTEPPQLLVSLGPDQDVCDSSLLESGMIDPTYTYLWSTGQTSESILVDSSGIYILTITDSSNCSESDTISVSVVYSPQADFTFEMDTTALTVQFQALDSLNVSTYFWDFGDGMTSTLANPLYTYADTGTYPVSLITQNGSCEPDTFWQEVQILPTVGLTPFAAGTKVKVYPNPADQSVAIEVQGALSQSLKIELSDLLGRVILQTEMKLERGNGNIYLPLSRLSNGVYLIHLSDQNNQMVRKLEVIH